MKLFTKVERNRAICGGVIATSIFDLMTLNMLKLYLRPNLRNTSDGYPLRGCWARCIDKKKEKKVHGQNLRPSDIPVVRREKPTFLMRNTIQVTTHHRVTTRV